MVAKVGEGVRKYAVGDRVMVFHHIPCRECYYCRHKTFAQCATYKKVGCTAGFEAVRGRIFGIRSGDGLDCARKERCGFRTGFRFEQACFVEPVNTCMKGIETLRLEAGETVLVMGQGRLA